MFAASAMLLGIVPAASATAIFSLSYTATLEYEITDELPTVAFIDIFRHTDQGSIPFMRGDVAFSSVFSPDGVTPITQSVSVSGIDEGPTPTADAIAEARHHIRLGFAGAANQFPFKLTLTWDMHVAVDDPTLERARAQLGISFSEYVLAGPKCLLDGVSTDCLYSFNVDTSLGEYVSSGTITATGALFPGALTIDDWDFSTIFTADARSDAQPVAVPEPSSLLLLTSGLVFALRRSWWMKRAAS